METLLGKIEVIRNRCCYIMKKLQKVFCYNFSEIGKKIRRNFRKILKKC